MIFLKDWNDNSPYLTVLCHLIIPLTKSLVGLVLNLGPLFWPQLYDLILILYLLSQVSLFGIIRCPAVFFWIKSRYFAGIIGCGYFCPSRFNPEICEIVKKIVPATRILWQMTKVIIVYFKLYVNRISFWHFKNRASLHYWLLSLTYMYIGIFLWPPSKQVWWKWYAYMIHLLTEKNLVRPMTF